MKKVVLIGASGFVGNAILNELLERGHEVTAVVRHPEKVKAENPRLSVVGMDVEDSARLTTYARDTMPSSALTTRDGATLTCMRTRCGCTRKS